MHKAGEKIDVAFGKKGKTSMEVVMIWHIMEAARGADLVLLMFDVRLGVTSDLAKTIKWLRKMEKSWWNDLLVALATFIALYSVCHDFAVDMII